MAKSKQGGVMYDNVYNETGPGEAPDTDGTRLYYSWDEIQAMHLTTGNLDSTPNTRGSEGILGGPASGEVNPAGLKG